MERKNGSGFRIRVVLIWLSHVYELCSDLAKVDTHARQPNVPIRGSVM